MRPAFHRPDSPKSVLITGASSGLGRAAAVHLSDLGYRVFAGVRTDASAAELSELSELSELKSSTGELEPVLLDVTDPACVARAGDVVERRCADTGLWAVVNNAGECVSAPLECIPIDVMRAQLETNLLGALAVTQRFLPLLRSSRGRVINVTSGTGNIAAPFLGPYATTQFGKEGFSDALRRELSPQGVTVSVIQPGAIDTPIWDKLRPSAEKIMAATPIEIADLYRGRFNAFLDANEAMSRASKTTPHDYAKAVAAALAAKHPKIRYRVGADAVGSAVARRLIPDRVMDALIAAMLPMTSR